MRSIITSLSLILITGFRLFSQDFLGFSNSNYAGINGMNLQPASIVDSRYKLDVNVAGAGAYIYNNYIGLHTDALRDSAAFSDPQFKANYLVLRDQGKYENRNKRVFFRTNLELPSAMYSLSDKHAVSFSWRMRSYMNIDGIEPNLAQLIWEELRYPSLYDTDLSNKKFNFQLMSWAEYGFGYARVLRDEGKHFVKAGGRLKLLQGLGAAYVFIDDLNYRFSSNDTASFLNSHVSYGHSSNITSKDFEFKYRFESSPGIGLDLGAVYEYRPNWRKYRYELDGDTGLVMKYKNKYKFKVGVSILDIGGIKFKRSDLSRDFIADITEWDLNQLNGIKSLEAFEDTISTLFTFQDTKSSFRMNLPTAISFQFDYNIYSDFYLNFTPFFALQYKNNENKIHDITTLTLAPRYDHKWFGVFLPFSYNSITGPNVGVSFRAGPVIFGTTDLLPYIGTRNIFGTDFHIALKVPIMYNKPKDRDNDKVSDKVDQCIDFPGVWAFKGCPDCDGDGISDEKDACPDEYGVAEFNGCPDRDGDKVMDRLDSCPDVPGVPELFGCPDSDGDKIIDSRDSCPDEPGIPEFFGCPDRDKDGVKDSEDLCPDDPGPIEQQGCPDKDGDGVFDNEDLCPDIPGLKENKGCPHPDKDGDGVYDKDDKCPETPGPKENNGCPKLEKEEEEVLNTAFSALEFETGKDVIKEESFSSLNELAKLMIKKPTWTLRLSGHTDNVGSPRKNLQLSKDRANSVKKYLVEKGVDEERIFTEWFGHKKPIASNNTKEGRQKNRRVEMTVQFR